MKKNNPYDPNYIMKRDQCTLDEALVIIDQLKEKNAWNRGKKIKKNNPYDPKYVMLRDHCSFEVAVEKIKDFKAKKATSLSNFIKRYGENEGTRRYDEWKEKSLAKGHQVVKVNGASQSRFSPKYYLRHGHPYEEAIQLALQYQHENSPLHIDYYLKRGLTLEFARKKIRSIHDKKIGIDSYKEHLKRTTNLTEEEIKKRIKETRGHFSKEKLGEIEFEERVKQVRKTFEQRGMWIPLEDLSDYKLYHRRVWEVTRQNDLTLLEHYEKRGRAGIDGAYHLDHKFSISRGYIEGVSPELIGSIKNLEFIPWEDNIQKQGKCSITLEELRNED